MAETREHQLTTALGREILPDCIINPFRKCREGKTGSCGECICDGDHNPVNHCLARLSHALEEDTDETRRHLQDGRWDTPVPSSTSVLEKEAVRGG